MRWPIELCGYFEGQVLGQDVGRFIGWPTRRYVERFFEGRAKRGVDQGSSLYGSMLMKMLRDSWDLSGGNWTSR